MKFFTKRLTILAALFALAVPASAQSGFNPFNEGKTIVVQPPTAISGGAAGSLTSSAVDMLGYEGVAQVNIFSYTNVGTGTLTATPQTSTDQATWANLANYAIASQANIIYTNRYYGTNGLTATNTFLLAGTLTSPTASTAGFATPYLADSTPFTNSGALTIQQQRIYSIAYNVQDAPRYFRIVFAPGGAATNAVVGAQVLARKQQFP